MSPLKKISLAVAIIATSNLVHSELVVLGENSTSKIDYVDPDEDAALSLSGDEIFEYDVTDDALAKKVVDTSPYLIRPSDYAKFGIKSRNKVYSDSEIWYSPKEDEFYEVKDFANRMRLWKVYGSKGAFIHDIAENISGESWYVRCHKDHITDEKICALTKYELMLYRSSKDGWFFSVSKEIEQLRPSQYQYLRIDKSPPLKVRGYYFKGQQVLNIIEQMKKGNLAYTRFYEWSKEYEETVPLKGFTVAYNTMNIMLSKL